MEEKKITMRKTEIKLTVKRSDLIRLANGLDSLKKVENINVAYSISKNLSSLKTEIESIEGALKNAEENNTETLKDYNKERMAIVNKYANKDEDGKLITDDNGNGSVNESNIKVFNNKITILNKKHKEQIDLVNEKTKEINVFLDVYVEVELFKIKIKDLPSDINFERLDLIKELID